MALDIAREARIAHKEAEASSMDKELYELEVERTKNLGNMTSALLMLATSMDALTRCCVNPITIPINSHSCVMLSANVLLCTLSYVSVPGNPTNPLSPSSLPTVLYPHSQGPLALEDGICHPPSKGGGHVRPLWAGGSPQVFGPEFGLCLPAVCCAKHNTRVQPLVGNPVSRMTFLQFL